jgi:hypothetical protein
VGAEEVREVVKEVSAFFGFDVQADKLLHISFL